LTLDHDVARFGSEWIAMMTAKDTRPVCKAIKTHRAKKCESQESERSFSKNAIFEFKAPSEQEELIKKSLQIPHV
jgi:hypothetical protein